MRRDLKSKYSGLVGLRSGFHCVQLGLVVLGSVGFSGFQWTTVVVNMHEREFIAIATVFWSLTDCKLLCLLGQRRVGYVR